MSDTLPILDSQLQKFTMINIRAFPIGELDYPKFQVKLGALAGKQIIGIDLGGDKVSATTFVVRNGGLEKVKETETLEADSGKGYLAFLEKQAELAKQHSLLVGVSQKGFVKGTRLMESPILDVFLSEFRVKYEADYAKLFESVVAINDAEAGLLASSTHTIDKRPEIINVLFVINGSGLNTAVLKGVQTFRTEAGHVELVEELNTVKQDKKCGMFGQEFVCIENVAGGKAGIEELWAKETGERLSGPEIAEKFFAKDPVAEKLYQLSAQVVSHMIIGVARSFGLMAELESTMIVCHGGTFQTPGYFEIVKEDVESCFNNSLNWTLSRDLGENVSLEGAAIAALIKVNYLERELSPKIH